MPNPITNRVLGFLSKLSFPRLFLITAALFVLDTAIPDFIPFADEILLGLGALILSNWQKPKQGGALIDVEPPPPPPPPPPASDGARLNSLLSGRTRTKYMSLIAGFEPCTASLSDAFA